MENPAFSKRLKPRKDGVQLTYIQPFYKLLRYCLSILTKAALTSHTISLMQILYPCILPNPPSECVILPC
ncbi:hypothetical protein GYH30_048623 [Glycine max]|uniref:Uncharacterized protein n=1 Tax=Glycine max TaxID=3847 RepID=A0A0R0EUJ8_SOYBN|nr:hypothetical protein GYH30_048623 [Glycine max]